MTTPETPPSEFRPPDRPPGPLRKPLGFAAGLGGGFLLWLIIGIATENLLLGILFGLVPGIAVGVALQVTARR